MKMLMKGRINKITKEVGCVDVEVEDLESGGFVTMVFPLDLVLLPVGTYVEYCGEIRPLTTENGEMMRIPIEDMERKYVI